MPNHRQWLGIDDVVSWTVWEFRDVLDAVLTNDQNVVFAVATGAWFAV